MTPENCRQVTRNGKPAEKRCRACERAVEALRPKRLRASHKPRPPKREPEEIRRARNLRVRINRYEEMGFIPESRPLAVVQEWEFYHGMFNATVDSFAKWMGTDPETVRQNFRRAGYEPDRAA